MSFEEIAERTSELCLLVEADENFFAQVVESHALLLVEHLLVRIEEVQVGQLESGAAKLEVCLPDNIVDWIVGVAVNPLSTQIDHSVGEWRAVDSATNPALSLVDHDVVVPVLHQLHRGRDS